MLPYCNGFAEFVRPIESKMRLGRQRWVVERTSLWIARYRRLTIRCGRLVATHRTFPQLGSALICWNYLQRL